MTWRERCEARPDYLAARADYVDEDRETSASQTFVRRIEAAQMMHRIEIEEGAP